jgi:hypothetical protein
VTPNIIIKLLFDGSDSLVIVFTVYPTKLFYMISCPASCEPKVKTEFNIFNDKDSSVVFSTYKLPETIVEPFLSEII